MYRLGEEAAEVRDQLDPSAALGAYLEVVAFGAGVLAVVYQELVIQEEGLAQDVPVDGKARGALRSQVGVLCQGGLLRSQSGPFR